MIRLIFFCMILVMQGVAAYSQDAVDILKQRNFKGTALYGYMNGGSDLYYEYGFKELDVTELNFTFDSLGVPVTQKYTVEVYKTETPQGAFGLYSVHVHKFLQRDMYGYFDCLTKYQLQGCVSNMYISIVFENPTEQGRAGAERLYKNYLDSLSRPAKFEIPPVVQTHLLSCASTGTSKMVSGVLKLITGTISLNNSAQDFYPLFEGFDKFELWLVEDMVQDKGLTYRAIVNFPSEKERDRFVEKNSDNKFSEDFAPVQMDEISGNMLYLTLSE